MAGRTTCGALVNLAHRHAMGVILDVVYNHFGPAGQMLDRFSDYYLSDRYETDWGKALNFDGPKSAGYANLS